MQDVTIKFLDGPLRGQSVEVEVGNVFIGRQPGAGGVELKGASTAVSRQHAVLVESNGDIMLQNKSPNGTTVNGKLVLDEVLLKSGTKIGIGDQYELTVSWKSFAAETRKRARPARSDTLKKGPLSSPIVRLLIAVYLGGMLAVGLWFAIASGNKTVADDWPALQAAYEQYQPEGMSDAERAAREARAAVLVRELRALKTRGLRGDSRKICRELMNIDRDIDSPLYRYGARCLSNR